MKIALGMRFWYHDDAIAARSGRGLTLPGTRVQCLAAGVFLADNRAACGQSEFLQELDQ